MILQCNQSKATNQGRLIYVFTHMDKVQGIANLEKLKDEQENLRNTGIIGGAAYNISNTNFREVHTLFKTELVKMVDEKWKE